MIGYLRERFKGTRPIAAGRQLQEFWMVMGIYLGSLGLESLLGASAAGDARAATPAAGSGEGPHA